MRKRVGENASRATMTDAPGRRETGCSGRQTRLLSGSCPRSHMMCVPGRVRWAVGSAAGVCHRPQSQRGGQAAPWPLPGEQGHPEGAGEEQLSSLSCHGDAGPATCLGRPLAEWKSSA